MQAFICITNTGDTALGANLNLYSNVDNFTSVIASIPLTSLVAPNCPYLATVPDGATTLRLIDPDSGCCFSLPFGNGFNLCEICEPLGFSGGTNPNIGSISVGQLTGGCDPNISNYYLEWYGPGTGSTNMIFTSGFGTNTYAGNYQRIHPLTGTSQVYLYPGQYRPKIREVELDNFIFSSDYGAYGDCFQDNPLVVLPYTISNGSAAPEPYQHCIEINNNGTQPSTGLIELSGGTNYVPFRLDGGLQADLLRIYFSGASYLTPIPIESIVIGSYVGLTSLTTEFNMTSSNIDYKTFGDSGTFTKVLCLTGLTRNSGDVLLFEITPQGTQPTDFTFCFTQLNTFDCEMCALTSNYYKIQQSTVSAITGNCGATQITFNVSGCSSSVDVNEDLYKYIFSGSGSALVNDAYGSVNKTINLTTTGPLGCNTQNFNYLGSIPPDCVLGSFTSLQKVPYQNTYNPTTGIRTIKIGANVLGTDPWYDYQNRILTSFQSTLISATSLGILTYGFPNLISNWSILTLWLPRLDLNFIGNSFFRQGCWDYNQTLAFNNGLKGYEPTLRSSDVPFRFAANTVVLTLTLESGFRILNITGSNFIDDPETTIIPAEYPVGPCIDGTCNQIGTNVFTNAKNIINNSLTNTTYNTNDLDFLLSPANGYLTMAYNKNPWSYDSIYDVSTAPLTSAITYNKISMYQYENKTYPLTGTSGNYGVKISETATTCPNILTYTFDENSGTTTLNNYVRYNYLYNVNYVDNSDNTKYQILATPISANGQPDLNATPTIIGSGNTVGNSFTVLNGSYFI